jgi:hypothetical protein
LSHERRYREIRIEPEAFWVSLRMQRQHWTTACFDLPDDATLVGWYATDNPFYARQQWVLVFEHPSFEPIGEGTLPLPTPLILTQQWGAPLPDHSRCLPWGCRAGMPQPESSDVVISP